MDRNFRVRVSVGVGLFAISLLALYTFDAIPFKIIYALFSVVAIVELYSFFRRGLSWQRLILALLETIFVIGSVIFVSRTDVAHFWYIILGVPGYDIFAYLSGKLLGGKIFKKSRPFPRISKNKTWEGTILGLAVATTMVFCLMLARGTISSEWTYLLCGPLALLGDLFESFMKRRFKVKDSNEIVIRNKCFARLEMFVGGSEGHGGFLDRVDSAAFACSALLIISLILQV